MSDTLLAFKAGRAFRRGATNTVEPSPTKGTILLVGGEDGLLRFQWKNRESDQIEEDLIVFPSDASFSKVTQSPGRIYVLKFSSSNEKHFFWLQDASTARDVEFINNLNGLLEDPGYQVQWNTDPQPQASSSSSTSTNPSTFQATPEQLAALSNVLSSINVNNPLASSATPPELALTDILTPANLTPLFASHPELIPALFPHLPPDLPVPPSPEVLQRIISSPHFRAAVASFDQGLRTGLLGGFVRSLGLSEEAGTGVVSFLRAIQEQVDREHSSGSGGGGSSSGERMDTD